MSLKHLSECLRSIALRESGEVRINKMRNFLELYSAEWYVYSAHAKVTLQKKKCNASEELSLKGDVWLLRNLVMEQIKNTMKRLDKGIVKIQDLEDLSKHTMSRTMTFNETNFGSPKSRWSREVERKIRPRKTRRFNQIEIGKSFVTILYRRQKEKGWY